jgi:hypothetical protein
MRTQPIESAAPTSVTSEVRISGGVDTVRVAQRRTATDQLSVEVVAENPRDTSREIQIRALFLDADARAMETTPWHSVALGAKTEERLTLTSVSRGPVGTVVEVRVAPAP